MPRDQPRAGKRCIFILDDEPAIRLLLRRFIDDMGFDVAEFADLAEAAPAVGERMPELIFLDLELMNSDAIEAFRAFADQGYVGTVQLISGRGEGVLRDVRVIGERYGFRLLPPITKPFRKMQIREVVESLSAKAEKAAEPLPNGKPVAEPAVAVTLAEALREKWLELWYQPQTDLKSGAVIGAEGLIRARHPRAGILAPAAFLPGASNESLAELTEFVLMKALSDWDRFHDIDRSLQLSVNVPVTALLSVPIASIVRRNRPTSQLWPGLTLEVTEDQVLSSLPLAQEIATQLRIYDVRLSVDDFGEGFSSLSRLRSLPFKSLKIDRSFVLDCAKDPAKASLCQSMIDMARSFGCIVVAEGIENVEDLDALRRMGCDVGQGYFLGRPMLLDALIATLK